MRLLVLLSLLFFPVTAQSQNSDSWSFDGQKAQICGGSSAACITLVCEADGGIALQSIAPYWRFLTGPIAVTIPGQNGFTITRPGPSNIINVTLDDALGRQIQGWLRAGSVLQIRSGNLSVQYTLAGSSAAIASLTDYCAAQGTSQDTEPQEASSSVPPDPFGGEYLRLPNEATLEHAIGEIIEGEAVVYRDTDLPGGDIRNGLTDPSLRNMTVRQCEALCLADRACRSWTHNSNGDVCFLKDDSPRPAPFRGATSGWVEGSWLPVLPPPTRGPGLVIDPDAAPRPDEPLEVYQARLRDLAVPLGRSCEAERRDLDEQLARFRWFKSRGRAAGEAVQFDWSGNDLIDRIPVWAMLATDAPVRFEGNGFFALGPDAPNPFGIDPGLGQTRALVALFSRGAGATGAIGLVPLEAGQMQVDMRLVAYLRACQETVVLSEDSISLNVAPALPQLVLTDVAGAAAFTHAVDVPQFDRRVEFNGTRFRILTGAGTEILARSGQGLSLSPTGRFVAVEVGSEVNTIRVMDIIDIVDGHIVSSLETELLAWLLNDSYVLTTVAPFGRVSLASTFGARVEFAGNVTGPACCRMFDGEGAFSQFLSLSLENASINLSGDYGHRLASLQSSGYESEEDTGSANASWSLFSEDLEIVVGSSLGPVGPVAQLEEGLTYPPKIGH